MTDERLRIIERDIKQLIGVTERLDERTKTLCEALQPMRQEIVEQCKAETKALGWKSISSIVVAVVSGLGALLTALIRL